MGCGASSLSVEDSQARARASPFPSLSSLSLAGPSLFPPFLARSVLTRLNLPWLQETRRLRASSSEIARTCGMRSRCVFYCLSRREGGGSVQGRMGLDRTGPRPSPPLLARLDPFKPTILSSHDQQELTRNAFDGIQMLLLGAGESGKSVCSSLAPPVASPSAAPSFASLSSPARRR